MAAAALAGGLLLLTGCAGAAESVPDEPRRASVGATASPARGSTPEGTLLVADFDGTTVSFVDPGKGADDRSDDKDGDTRSGGAFDTVEVGTAPYGLAVGDDGRAWVATAEGVAVVDTAHRRSLGRVPYKTNKTNKTNKTDKTDKTDKADTGPARLGEYRGGGMGIALAPDGKRLYVGVNVPDGNGVMEVIDTATREVVGTAPVGRRPFDVVVAPDGSEAYSVDHDSYSVTAVRASDLATRRIEVAPYGSEGGLGGWLKPHYAAVDHEGRLLLPFEGERLAVLDPTTGRVDVRRMTAGTHQHGAALTPDGRLLVVGTGSDGTVDGPPSLTVRERDGRERVVKLDGPHEDIAVSPDGRTAYVSGGFTRAGFWDGVTVVDLDTGSTRRVAAGARPLGIAVLGGRLT